MTACQHCKGTGAVQQRETAMRGNALGKLPPFGREVEQAAREGRLPILGVMVFYKPIAPNEFHMERDAWALAAECNAARPGSAMVLPVGADVKSFRWPAIPSDACDTQIAFCAYGCAESEQVGIARDLLAVGYRRVFVLGGPGCPLTFETTPTWGA